MNRVHSPPRPSDREQLPFWYATVLDCQRSSGLTMADFIIETGISNSSLYKWRQRLINESIYDPTKPVATNLIEVTVARQPARTTAHMTVRNACRLAADSTKQEIESGNARPDMIYAVNLGFDAIPGFGDFKVRVTHRWRVFRAKQASHSVTGSYAETDGTFLGQVVSPAIDTWSGDPGPGWEEVPALVGSLAPNAVNLILP
jgi:transposase-like protein